MLKALIDEFIAGLKKNIVSTLVVTAILPVSLIGTMLWDYGLKEIEDTLFNRLSSVLERDGEKDLDGLSAAEKRFIKAADARLTKAIEDRDNARIGAINAGNVTLTAGQPTHSFGIYLPKDNKGKLYVSVTWNSVSGAPNAPIAILIDEHRVTTIADAKTKMIDLNKVVSLAQKKRQEAKSSTGDLIEAESEDKRMEPLYKIELRMPGSGMKEGQTISVKYVAVVLPLIKGV